MNHYFIRNRFIFSFLLFAVVAVGYSPSQAPMDAREQYRIFLMNHPFSQHRMLERADNEGEGEDEDEDERQDRPDLAWEQDFLRTMDPTLGRPAPERLSSILKSMSTFGKSIGAPGSSATPWVERGPNNVGGRTRALVWDPNDPNGTKVWAGGVTGGLWYNNNITVANSPWNPVNDFWNNIAITSIAFDPNNSQIMYVGTGEGWGAASSRGAGIWKSTDGGSTWNQLASTSSYYFVNDIAIRNESGTSVIYAAVDGLFYNGSFHGAATAGLQRSVNGGTSWTQVLPTVPTMSFNFVAADIDISASNRIWIGTKASPYGGNDRGGGRVLYSDNGTTWTTSSTTTVTNGTGRVNISSAKSNANYVYSVVESSGATNSVNRTTNAGTSWGILTLPVDTDTGIPSTDFTRGQAWYDLVIAVDPNNENNVIVGGVDLFRTTNGGTSWNQISKWSNNNNLSSLPCALVHADQHVITYKPGSSSTVLFGNDGGVFYSSNIAASATSATIGMRNTNYNVTQFYACAMNPTANSNNYLAGAQDNGSQRFTQTGLGSTNTASGGDGAYCFIDQTNPNFQITSYVYNTYYLSTNGGTSFSTTLSADQATGKFINPSDYDDNMHILYSTRTTGALNRIRNITTTPTSAEIVTIPGLNDKVSHIRVSPYTTTSSTLFLGTDAGAIWKVTTANATPTATNITGSGMPTGSVSCIEIGASDSELVVTYFNYGVTSVWYTNNAGTTWTSKEGNLPDMPVRWALFNPGNRNEVILATELGVWSTTGFNSGSPSWAPSNTGLANVRVDMLQIRNSDLQVTAATFGRGLFTSNGFAASTAPIAGFKNSLSFPCLNEVVILTDTSWFYPTSWSWSISPNTFQFSGGTSASSQHPKIIFTASGTYSVTLSVSNASGTHQVTRNALITAGGFAPPFTEDWETSTNINRWTIDNQDLDNSWAIATVSGNSPGTKAIKMSNFNNTTASVAPTRDGLISPVIRLNGMGTASMSFKYAYRRYNTTRQDSLAVFVSTDCGTTWTRVASYGETQATSPFSFITNTNSTSAFTPASTTDWCGVNGFGTCRNINLNAFAGQSIKVKFENISNNGNNLYLDDISFTGTAASPVPVANIFTANTTPCAGNTVSFRDTSTNTPTNWQWTITPNTVNFVNGTSANSQHPEMVFSTAGSYTIKLRVSNSSGADSITKTNYVTVQSSVIPTISINANDTDICSGTMVNFTSTISNGGSTPVYQWRVNSSNSVTTSTLSATTFNHLDTIRCTLISNATCAVPASMVSNAVVMIVHAKPVVSLTLPTKNTCQNDSPVTLSGNLPLGGVFSGTSVTGGQFKPAVAGTGKFPIVYSFTDGFGCQNTATDSISVNVLPSVSFILPNKKICIGDSIQLTGGSPAGGQYSGTGTQVGYFKSKLSGTGIFATTYSYTDSKGCSNKALDSITVNALPTVSLSLTTQQLCNNDTTISLAGGSPAGGVYSGTGVSGNTFKTSLSGPGKSIITYTVSDGNNCKNKANDSITVNALPAVSFILPGKVFCFKDTSILLSSGLPTGGIYSGTGVTNNLFKTAVSGSGKFPITYQFSDAKGCVNRAIDTFTVNAIPTVTLALGIKHCCSVDTSVQLSGGNPASGVYVGTSVTGNKFKPTNAGIGDFRITYIYTDPKGCSNNASDSLHVHANPAHPVVTISGDTLTCNATGVTFSWYLNGNLISGATTSQLIIPQNGSYKVRVTNGNNCFSESNSIPMVKGVVNELTAGGGFTVYPNPSTGLFTIEFYSPRAQTIMLTVNDLTGRLIKTVPVICQVGTNVLPADLRMLQRGQYVVQLIADDHTSHRIITME